MIIGMWLFCHVGSSFSVYHMFPLLYFRLLLCYLVFWSCFLLTFSKVSFSFLFADSDHGLLSFIEIPMGWIHGFLMLGLELPLAVFFDPSFGCPPFPTISPRPAIPPPQIPHRVFFTIAIISEMECPSTSPVCESIHSLCHSIMPLMKTLTNCEKPQNLTLSQKIIELPFFNFTYIYLAFCHLIQVWLIECIVVSPSWS
ncbi:hypothetical protein EV426DRAFT_278406 [Tirmania nivea]|nr:hypothetical protein EV426DRAFT_278406 [Tirmania nivea]